DGLFTARPGPVARQACAEEAGGGDGLYAGATGPRVAARPARRGHDPQIVDARTRGGEPRRARCRALAEDAGRARSCLSGTPAQAAARHALSAAYRTRYGSAMPSFAS